MKRKPGSSAASLVEILVVLFIIAVVAGITFPVFRAVKDRTRTASCSSNLAQIGKALHIYAADHDTMLPHYMIANFQSESVWLKAQPESWRDSLLPLVGSVELFYCPADDRAGTSDTNGDVAGGNSLVTSYEQVVVHGTMSMTGWAVSIDQPISAGVAYLQDRVRMTRGERGDLVFDSHHGARMNVLFLDGSVKNITVTD